MKDIRWLTRQPLKSLYFLFWVLVSGSPLAIADTPNPAFGDNGWSIDSFLSGDVTNYGNDAAIQPDGKIVVVGENEGNAQDTIVVRYNVDGSLDTSFDGDGKVLIDGGGDDRGNAVALQADGKIVVAGMSYSNGATDFVLLRLNADGSPDVGFGTDGIVLTDLSANEEAEDVVIQADGKIVVVGTGIDDATHLRAITVLRHNSDGSLDTSFDTDGIVTISIGGEDSAASSVALQADGKIVVGGSSGSFIASLAVIVRYNTNGSLDTTFDTDGVATWSTGEAGGGFEDLAIQANQMIVAVTNTSENSGPPNFITTSISVLRFNTNGSLDTGFDSDGIASVAVAVGDAWGNSIAIQADNKIVAAGESYDFEGSGIENYLVARFNADGSLDTGFDTDGYVETEITPFESNGARAVVIQTDSKIVAAGSSNEDVGVVRYNTDGSLDTGFSGDGKVTTPVDSPLGGFYQALVVQSDGKIIVGGEAYNSNDSDLALARYNMDGTLDTTFDSDGKVTLSLSTKGEGVRGVAVQTDGKILAVDAHRLPTSEDAALVRFNADGSLDGSFGGGIIITNMNINDVWNDVIVQPDNKIVVSGGLKGLFGSGVDDFAVARFNSDGAPDVTFGTGGVFKSGLFSAAMQSVLLPDGKIVVAGQAFNGSTPYIAVARITSGGVLDTSFGGGDGYFVTSLRGQGNSDIVKPLGVQCDGKIVVAGTFWNGVDADFGVARFTADGDPDLSFDTDGVAILDLGPSEKGYDVEVQADGKILVGGKVWEVEWKFGLARFNSDGSLDTGFATNGVGLYSQTPEGQDFTAMTLVNGHVYMAGQVNYDAGLLDVAVSDAIAGCPAVPSCSAPPLPVICAVPDAGVGGVPGIAVTMPGSTRVHIRDGSTDALITDIDFGSDLAFDMAVLPDLDASGDPEIAILQQQASGQVRVQARDSVTGLVTSNFWYGLQYEAVSMAVVPDYNSNGFPEIAVLGSEAGTDAVRVQIKDSDTTTTLDNIFLGTQSIATDLVSVSDTNGNGIPEIGILGVLKANDHVRMQVWDPIPPLVAPAEFQTNVWYGKVYQPQSTISIPDINSNGSDEIVAVGVDPATQNIRVQVRDSDTTDTLFNIWLGNVNEAVDIALVNDINSNGFPDLAVLLKTPAGGGRVRIQDGGTGAFIRNLFFSVVENPVGLAVMPDYSGNGFDELAALGESAGVRHVQILDTNTGGQVNRIDFP